MGGQSSGASRRRSVVGGRRPEAGGPCGMGSGVGMGARHGACSKRGRAHACVARARARARLGGRARADGQASARSCARRPTALRALRLHQKRTAAADHLSFGPISVRPFPEIRPTSAPDSPRPGPKSTPSRPADSVLGLSKTSAADRPRPTSHRTRSVPDHPTPPRRLAAWRSPHPTEAARIVARKRAVCVFAMGGGKGHGPSDLDPRNSHLARGGNRKPPRPKDAELKCRPRRWL